MVLSLVALVGIALAFYPSWRLCALIGVILSASVLCIGGVSGQPWFGSVGWALLYLFVMNGSFVAASLVLDLDVRREIGSARHDDTPRLS